MSHDNIIARRILIADEDEDAVEILGLLLSLDGHEVKSALNGRTAHSIAREFQPDLILTYVGMRDIEWNEAAANFSQAAPKAKVVALIDWRQESSPARWRDNGYHSHLIKPVELKHVKDLLEDKFI